MVLDQEKKKYPNPTSIAESLVADGADPNDANQDGFTCLMYAARNGHFETTQHLLGLPGIDPNKCNTIGCNAMHYAAQNAHKDVCELLRKAGGVNRRVGDRTMLNRTPKDMALREEQELRDHKLAMWEKTVKERKYLLVEEYEKTAKEDKITVPETPLTPAFQFISPAAPYHFFANMPDPKDVKPPKEWKANRWRVSKVPDPSCKLDPMPESAFMKRSSPLPTPFFPPLSLSVSALSSRDDEPGWCWVFHFRQTSRCL